MFVGCGDSPAPAATPAAEAGAPVEDAGGGTFTVSGLWPPDLYLLQNCTDLAGNCLSGVTVNRAPATLVASLSASTTYFLVIDADRAHYAGDYTLEVDLAPDAD